MEPSSPPSGALTASPETAQSPEHKKRNRIRFSCTTCREKKLKCNRSLPCDQCEKRGITATCQFVPYHHPREDGGSATSPWRPRPAQRRPSAGDATLQARLRHLEHLVSVLKAQKRDAADGAHVSAEAADASYSQADEPEVQDSSCFGLKETAGPIVGESRYVDVANWEAILEDITRLTDDLKTFDGAADAHDFGVDLDMPRREGPVLLLGAATQATVPEMLGLLPPRMVTDRLVARFFQGKEPAWMMFHVPTFLAQYEEFWKMPEGCTFTWLGLLFMMISHASLFILRGDEEVPGKLGEPLHVSDTFRDRAAQCLILDDYTTPGKYKIETLILYFGAEYLRQTEAHLGCSVVLSLIVRLAMHMGYQRDPKHFRDISTFEGEMRRRIWTLLTEIDELVSFQFGLPANIQARYFDTEPPSNLYDEDFDENTAELPPSRPETERTPALYIRTKARVMIAFGEILATINSRDATPYEQVRALDKRLEEAHDCFPQILRMRSFSQSVTDPTDLIMQRYWLELLYQKARSVLHRKFLGAARFNNRYAYSRWTCIDAATKTLQHQYDIHVEMQPGGRLSKERWFVSSVSIHDFLLADMILCLELSYAMHMSERGSPRKQAEPEKRLAPLPQEQLLEILRTSRSIWQTSRKESSEANRAFKILTRMLATTTGTEYESSPESSGSAALEVIDLKQPPTFQFSSSGPSFQQFTPPTSFSLSPHVAPTPGSATPSTWGTSSGLDVAPPQDAAAWRTPIPYMPGTEFGTLPDNMEGLIDPSLTSDWSLWDNQIQNSSVDMMQITWNSFFPEDS